MIYYRNIKLNSLIFSNLINSMCYFIKKKYFTYLNNVFNLIILSYFIRIIYIYNYV